MQERQNTSSRESGNGAVYLMASGERLYDDIISDSHCSSIDTGIYIAGELGTIWGAS